MSHVRTKNAVVRALAQTFPQCAFAVSLERGCIGVGIQDAPFPCLKDDKITLHPTGGYSYTVGLFGKGEQSGYTPECELLKEQVKERVRIVIASMSTGTSARFWVYAGDAWIAAQAKAKRAALAATVAA